jgi:elongation factor Ts
MPLLKELRALSGAPMVECKKALEHTENLDDAMDWLRKHGAAKASSKLAGRDAQEGLVGLLSVGTSASLVQVASETDFAGRSKAFSDLVEHVTRATLHGPPGPIDDSTLLSLSVNDKTVQEAMEEAIVSIRENLKITSATHHVAQEGQWIGYVHGKVSENTGTAAAVVHVKGNGDLESVGKQLAMHVVAARPLFLTPEDVPESDLNREKDILKEQLVASGKPGDIVDKIVHGRMRKYFETVCLTEQAHMVVEGNPKVQKVLDDADVQVTYFECRSVG